MRKLFLLLCAGAIFLASCTGSNKAQQAPETASDTSIPVPPKVRKPKWLPKDGPYQPSERRLWDQIHTTLYISFDWEKQHVIGRAHIRLEPYMYPMGVITLDAKGFELKQVAMEKSGEMTDLQYTYDGKKIRVQLPAKVARPNSVHLYIDYIAKPNEVEQEGSAAITSAKGLYFINPDGSDPKKPRQIWTQGETEASSCWFPCIDSPNDRTTSDLYLTVPKDMVTLSNGILVDQQDLPDDTRTDYWRMEYPHPAYLFAIVVGEFAIVKDDLGGMEVSYYVEPKYEPHARAIFGNTPEMIDFFSQKLQTPYPWPKYGQAIVRDFVSGAMENTTATIHGEFVAHTTREKLDRNSDAIIAHELFHHWFGDLVTCESWANLPLNESFATYGEYLWYEHKYGPQAADRHLQRDLTVYLMESRRKREPLIRYHYQDKEQMFDAHSYQKGGRVLHMLRKYVGDEAFFKSLRYYLDKNAYTDVEIHELRMAFEDVVGEDLNWFFNQWFLQRGHPELEVTYDYDESTKLVNVRVLQTQNLDFQPLYRLFTQVGVYVGSEVSHYPIEINSLDTTYSFSSLKKPDFVDFDWEKMLLADVDEEKEVDEWTAQLKYGETYVQKSLAYKNLKIAAENPTVQAVLMEKLEDSYWAVREEALKHLKAIPVDDLPAKMDKVRSMAGSDEEASVRAEAIKLVGHQEETSRSAGAASNPENMQVIRAGLKDQSYDVIGTSLDQLFQLEPEEGLAEARKLKDEENAGLRNKIGGILMDSGSPEAVEFVGNEILSGGTAFTKYSLVRDFATFLDSEAAATKRSEGISIMQDLASGKDPWWLRMLAVDFLGNWKSEAGVTEFLTKLQETEENDRLKASIEKALSETE